MNDNHHKMMIQDFKKRFWISSILTLPILLLSPTVQHLFGYQWLLPGNDWILLILSSFVYFYGGWPFLIGCIKEIKNKNPGMMTLIGLAITVAYIYSVTIVLGLTKGMSFFWELATLVDIMLLGHWIEMKSVLSASRALNLLVHMLPAQAHVIRNGQIEDVPLDQVHINDLILIKPGEKIPADGVVVKGSSDVNESFLTGESKSVAKTINSEVIGGSLNGQGSLEIKVKHTGKESYLAKVINLVEQAQKTKSKTQNLADRAARYLTYVALAVGIITFIVWLSLGYSSAFSIERMVTVMVISCPHALGLAIPLVVAISTAIAARSGLLIRNRNAFENARKITTVIFDKTGTLTTGKFGVVKFESLTEKYNKLDILKFAGALEQKSEHPIALSIMNEVKKQALVLPAVTHFRATPGRGIAGEIDHQSIQIVGPGYLKEKQMSSQYSLSEQAIKTRVFVIINNELSGYFDLADQIRPESYQAVNLLKKNHIRVIMLTGDNRQVAQQVSEELGLDGFYAEVLPHQKLEIVKDLQNKGEFIAMAGDGINDAPALAQANVGIAVGSGTDIAAETADIILVESNPKDIVNLILFGKATYQKMIQNLFWATGYNVLAIPLAAGVLYPLGLVLSPAAGAVLMSLSTVIVAINAQFLRNKATV